MEVRIRSIALAASYRNDADRCHGCLVTFEE